MDRTVQPLMWRTVHPRSILEAGASPTRRRAAILPDRRFHQGRLFSLYHTHHPQTGDPHTLSRPSTHGVANSRRSRRSLPLAPPLLRGRADLRCWVGFPNEVKVVNRPLTCSSRCKLPCDCRRRWRLCPLQRRFLRPDGRHSDKLHPLQPGVSALFRDSLKSTLSRLHQYLYVQDPQYKLHRLLGEIGRAHV